MANNPLQQILDNGQSPWIDFITRDFVKSGKLQANINQGITGMTSNPTILQKAIGGGASDYADDLRELVKNDASLDDIYDALVLSDIRNAAMTFRPTFDRVGGIDGYVSIEVAPHLAHDTELTFTEAKRINSHLNLPNIMIKIPGTPEGIPAFKKAIADGMSVNVTLLFALDSYKEVAANYVEALEERVTKNLPINHINSVASFFVSRVDSAIDKLLDAKAATETDPGMKAELARLRGKAAIANAKLAYRSFQSIFSGPRWEALAAKGAHPQRPLWASTSSKDAAYRDTVYVEELIGPHTVNTMPPVTIEATLDHGKIGRTIDVAVDQAEADIDGLARVGINLSEVTLELQTDGVRLFGDSFDDLMKTIAAKRDEFAVRVS